MEASGKTLLIADTGGQMDRVPQLIRTFEEHRVEGLLYVADHHSQVSLCHKCPIRPKWFWPIVLMTGVLPRYCLTIIKGSSIW